MPDLASGLPSPAQPMPWDNLAAPQATPQPAAAPQQAAGVPVTPSLVPIYNRESGLNFQAQNPTSTASGAGQDINSTWHEAMHALGYGNQWPTAKSAPPEIQNAANVWLQGRYGNKPWAASDPTLKQSWSATTPEENQALKAHTTATSALSASLSSQLQKYAEAANAAPPGSKERDDAIAQLRANSSEMMADWRKMVHNPPAATPVQGWQQMGSVGFILAALAGLMSRQHITAGLTAAGSALNAINKNSKEEYERQVQTWHDQVSLGAQMINLENENIKSLLEDRHMAESEKSARLNTMEVEFGLQNKIGEARLGDIDTALQFYRQRAQALQSFNERVAIAQMYANARGAKVGKPQQFDVTTQDGKRDHIFAQEGVVPGTWFDARDGHPLDMSKYKNVEPVSQSQGRMAATQVARIQGAGSELAATLTNLQDMPISATRGFLMGVQTMTPDTLAEAAQRTLANKLTPAETRAYIYSAQGIARFMAQLESIGAATGLVGLTQAAQSAIPAEGDSGYDILRKYAELKQVAERGLKTALTLPGVSEDQKGAINGTLSEIETAVPWTVHDVNALQFSNSSVESVSAFAQHVKASGAGAMPQGVPPGSHRAGTYKGNPVWIAPNGSRYVVQP